MKILGINYLSESSVCLIQNGKIKFAISEERLNRKKNWWGNPYKSIDYLLKKTGNSIKDIDFIATHGFNTILNSKPNKKIFDDKISEIENSRLANNIKKKQKKFIRKRYLHEIKANKRNYNNIKLLKKKYGAIEVYDHHKAHAASAYYFSGWKKCYVLTIDGWGDNSSSKLYLAKNGKLNLITSTNSIDSLGYFYGSITKMLGFKPHSHEGKVLGLAAYGNYKKAYRLVSKMISYDYKKKSFKGNYEKGLYVANFNNPNINFLKKNFKMEDIAAAAQRRLEDVVNYFIKDNLPKNSRLALAGGVFANVKLNQKISEHKNIRDVFVFPNMGDGGLSVGAAALSYYDKKVFKPVNLNNVYLGPEYSNSEIKKILKISNVNFFKMNRKKTLQFISKKIQEGNVVGCFQGRMEFGPRALGNRSILASTESKDINIWLNKKLKRTEFMPFAPITTKNLNKMQFQNLFKKKKLINFMTVTTNCTKEMSAISPAAVHIDRTARPQILARENNPKIYDLINEYYKISKIPCLINTSFNVHEEPIVCDPQDAIRAFKSSKLDYLYIGDFIVKSK